MSRRGIQARSPEKRSALLFTGRKATEHDLSDPLWRDAVMVILCQRVVGSFQPEMRAHPRLLDMGVHLQTQRVGVFGKFGT